jgi:hypothetical protein
MRTLLAGLWVAASLAVAYIGCGLSTQGNNVGGFTEVDGGSTSTAGSGGGGTVCESEADCADDTDCATYKCVDKRCQVTLSPEGTEVAADKIVGDCRRRVCSGSGTVSEVNADDDPPESPNPCTTKSCAGGEIITTIVTDNEPCGMNQYCKAGVCIGCQMASECKPPTDCSTVECTNQQCIYTPIPAGTEVENTNPSDCMHTICNAGGMKQTVPDTMETPPPDNEVCTEDKCSPLGGFDYAPTNEGGTCAPMSLCADASTCMAGTCTPHPKPEGPIGGDADGNCKTNYCDGNGNLMLVSDDTDEPPDDPMDCLVPNCVNGTNVPDKLNDGTNCGPGNMRDCCNGVCCMNNTDQCVENMCCAPDKVCGGECCGAMQTCSMLGDGGFTCTP